MTCRAVAPQSHESQVICKTRGVKKLGKFSRTGRKTTDDRIVKSRGSGWQFVHVCIDDHSRLGFSQVLASQRREDAVAFLRAAVVWYQQICIRIERVLTNNGSCYCSKAFNRTCKALGLRHIYTRPYTPKTNVKAERVRQENDSLDRFLNCLTPVFPA